MAVRIVYEVEVYVGSHMRPLTDRDIESLSARDPWSVIDDAREWGLANVSVDRIEEVPS